MDCRNDGGIIEIVWDETITFYGEKESTVMDSCQLKDGSCTTAVSGTNMEGRLEDLCGKQVRCTVEFEQTWVEDECGINTLNYLELVYKCVIPGTIFYLLYEQFGVSAKVILFLKSQLLLYSFKMHVACNAIIYIYGPIYGR